MHACIKSSFDFANDELGLGTWSHWSLKTFVLEETEKAAAKAQLEGDNDYIYEYLSVSQVYMFKMSFSNLFYIYIYITINFYVNWLWLISFLMFGYWFELDMQNEWLGAGMLLKSGGGGGGGGFLWLHSTSCHWLKQQEKVDYQPVQITK